jgi:SseB protein C-terminal domain/SseB protein N-terminal domain
MGLFDIFKKKTSQPAASSLSLEALLQRSASEPAYRSDFYKRLLSDELVVITKNQHLPAGAQTLQEDAQVNIVSYDDGKIPVFTSKERIFDGGVVKEEVQFMQMKGENLFGLAKGAAFVLNPYSDFGKELLTEEVERMLNGEIFMGSAKTLTIDKNTKVLISQPAKYPTEIINTFKVLFASKPFIKAAYLGWIHNPETGQPPHYIFGLETDGNVENITQEAGDAIQQFLAPSEIIDFISVNKKGGLSDYFRKSTEPFYKR